MELYRLLLLDFKKFIKFKKGLTNKELRKLLSKKYYNFINIYLLSLEYVALEQLAMALVLFGSGGIYKELHSSQRVDLRELISIYNTA